MTIIPVLRWLPVAAALMLMAPISAYALSVYDIIQLNKNHYSDEDILALIKATDSAFKLKAEDIVRLKELGISEPVMQAMLKATHIETEDKPAATPPTRSANISDSHAHIEPASASDTHTGTATAFVVPDTSKHFDSSPFKETKSGHHHHNAVNLMGVRLLVLRDEGAFPSVAARADTIVERLQQAVTAGKGTFQPDPVTNNSILFYAQNSNNPLIILTVSNKDASAYQRRSDRNVTTTQLTAYWSDLLSDYWSIIINSTTPNRLAGLHEGEVLKALHEQWQKSNLTESAQLADAAQLLTRQQQQHLLKLAITVPQDFLINTSHLAKQP